MNCKPGDLAVVVRGKNCGVLVDVIEPHWFFQGVWKVRVHADVLVDLGTVVRKGSVTGCADGSLRPIRDPGPEAQDETLSWLPVPCLDEVSA